MTKNIHKTWEISTWEISVECAGEVIQVIRGKMGDGTDLRLAFDSIVDHDDLDAIIADCIQSYIDRAKT
jgi:hypothetical protein